VGAGIEHGRTTGPKILISFEQGFHAYQETLAAALRILLPDAEVLTVRPEEIGGMASLFGPDVVIGSPLEGVHVEDVPAWVELSNVYRTPPLILLAKMSGKDRPAPGRISPAVAWDVSSDADAQTRPIRTT